MTKNLTTGSPMKLILCFTLPTLFGMLFQQMYNMVDTMIVGKLLGAQALAAVGATGSINFLVIGFCTGVCSGFAIPVAQQMGAENYSQMRRYAANAAYLSVVFAVVMTIATGLLCGRILTAMDTPADIYEDSYRYIFIIFMSIPVTYLYNLLSGVIRSLGDSRTPVYFLAMSSVLNIGLDLVLILHTDLGVAGAAIATVVSQGVSGLACLAYMYLKFPIPHDNIIPTPELKQLLKLRERFAYGEQTDYFDDPSIVGFTRLGEEEHPDSGMAVLATDSTAGEKRMYVGRQFAGCVFYDALSGSERTVTIDNEGSGAFYVDSSSVAVWVTEQAYLYLCAMVK